ncbi:MAG: hypothetical protein ACK4Z4_06195, partial [Ferrovibrio sp.]
QAGQTAGGAERGIKTENGGGTGGGDHDQAPVQGGTGVNIQPDQWVNNYQGGNKADGMISNLHMIFANIFILSFL